MVQQVASKYIANVKNSVRWRQRWTKQLLGLAMLIFAFLETGLCNHIVVFWLLSGFCSCNRYPFCPKLPWYLSSMYQLHMKDQNLSLHIELPSVKHKFTSVQDSSYVDTNAFIDCFRQGTHLRDPMKHRKHFGQLKNFCSQKKNCHWRQ